MTDVRIAQRTERVVVGVDTHGDLHVAAALDPLGRMLGRLEVGTSTRGYTQLLKWAHTFSPTTTFGVEGTGAYGAGLARFLIDAGCEVIEINRPDRRARRGHGKSDPIDAEAAARSVLAGGRPLFGMAFSESYSREVTFERSTSVPQQPSRASCLDIASDQLRGA